MLDKIDKISFIKADLLKEFSLGFGEKIIDFDADGKQVYVIGDLHQDSNSLKSILKATGFFEKEVYLVFLGDYIDRGEDPFLINKLLILRHYYGERIILLRGNHEVSPFSELKAPKTDEWDFFNYLKSLDFDASEEILFYHEMFEKMPVLCRVKYRGFNILLLHGGLPRVSLKNGYPKKLEYFFGLNSPIGISYENDFLWNDFGYDGYNSKIRSEITQKESEYFLQQFGFDYIIRSHEYVKEGYKTDFDRIITIFSNGSKNVIDASVNEESAYSGIPALFDLTNSEVCYFYSDKLIPVKKLYLKKFNKKVSKPVFNVSKKVKLKRVYFPSRFRVLDMNTGRVDVFTQSLINYKNLQHFYGIDVSFAFRVNKIPLKIKKNEMKLLIY